MTLARRISLGFAGLVVIAVLACGAVILSDTLSQPPAPGAASLIAKERAYHVRIRRDNFGVPHILGVTDADVAFGLGFAHSEDDFADIQEAALASRGTLAALEGPHAATTDYLVRLMRVKETVDAGYLQL